MIRIIQTHADPNESSTTCDEHGRHEMYRMLINGVEIPLCQLCLNQIARQSVPLMDDEEPDMVDITTVPRHSDGRPQMFTIAKIERETKEG